MSKEKGKKQKGSKKEKQFDIASELIDFDEQDLYLSILGYGKNGRGKTTFAGTMPKPCVLDFNERGELSLRGKGIKGWRVDNWEKVENIYWYLHSGRHPFESVIWDTGTSAADVALEHVMGIAGEYDTSAGKLVTRQDWGNMSKEMKHWITKFRNLEMHKAFLFQEKSLDEDDLDEGEHAVVPMVSPAVRAVAGAAVDVIARFELIEKKIKKGKGIDKKTEKIPVYRMRIGPSERYLTKIRTPNGVKLEASQFFIEDPNFDKVMELYKSLNR